MNVILDTNSNQVLLVSKLSWRAFDELTFTTSVLLFYSI